MVFAFAEGLDADKTIAADEFFIDVGEDRVLGGGMVSTDAEHGDGLVAGAGAADA